MKLHNFHYAKGHCRGPSGLGILAFGRGLCSIGQGSYYLFPENFQDLGNMDSVDDSLIFFQGGRMSTGDTSLSHMKLTGDVYPRIKSDDTAPLVESGAIPCERGTRVTWSHLGQECFHSYIDHTCYSFVDGQAYTQIGFPQSDAVVFESNDGLPTVFLMASVCAVPIRLADAKNEFRTCLLEARAYTQFVCDSPQSLSVEIILWEPYASWERQIGHDTQVIGPFLYDSFSSAESIVFAVEQQLMSLCRSRTDWARRKAKEINKAHASYSYSIAYTLPSLSSLATRAKYDMLQLFSTGPSADQWGEIAQTAVQDCRWTDINSIAYLKDLREMFGTAKALAGLFADYENPKKWLNAYLSLKYGDRLTYADSVELVSAISDATASLLTWKKDFHAVRAAHSYSITNDYGSFTADCRYKIYYRNPGYPLLDSIKTLMDWDLYPTLSNLWDLVPFSFVVDWFVSVGDFLEAFDDNIYVQYLDIIHCTKSCKMTCSASQLPSLRPYAISGGVGTYYVRTTPVSPDLPVPSLHKSDSWRDNLLTLGAIILQKC